MTGMKAGERRRLKIPAGDLTDPIKQVRGRMRMLACPRSASGLEITDFEISGDNTWQDVDVEVTFERKSGLMKFFNGN